MAHIWIYTQVDQFEVIPGYEYKVPFFCSRYDVQKILPLFPLFSLDDVFRQISELMTTLKCVIPVVCIWTNKWVCSQHHNCICLIGCYILRSKYYNFRPVVAIIGFYHLTHLRLFYTIRVAACLMRRSQHQKLCWSIVPLYWVYGWTT